MPCMCVCVLTGMPICSCTQKFFDPSHWKATAFRFTNQASWSSSSESELEVDSGSDASDDESDFDSDFGNFENLDFGDGDALADLLSALPLWLWRRLFCFSRGSDWLRSGIDNVPRAMKRLFAPIPCPARVDPAGAAPPPGLT